MAERVGLAAFGRCCALALTRAPSSLGFASLRRTAFSSYLSLVSLACRYATSPFFTALKMAERVGFEPTVPFDTPHFECGAIDHSATSPVAERENVGPTFQNGSRKSRMFTGPESAVTDRVPPQGISGKGCELRLRKRNQEGERHSRRHGEKSPSANRPLANRPKKPLRSLFRNSPTRHKKRDQLTDRPIGGGGTVC
jgi:hypothetical protein